MELAEYRIAKRDNLGFCSACNELTTDIYFVPGDYLYSCDDCGEESVSGVVASLELGLIQIKLQAGEPAEKQYISDHCGYADF